MTLEQVVRAACDADDVHSAAGGEDEALAYLSAGLTEFSRDETVSARLLRDATNSRRAGGAVALDPAARAELERDGLPELSVMASGNLGSVTLPREPGRVTLERLQELHPRLLPALLGHPGIAFALVRTDDARRGRPLRARRALGRRAGSSRARTRSLPSGRTPPTTCGARTATRTAPTSCSTRPTGRPTTRWPRSRSSSAPTAAWAARRVTPSCCSRASLPYPDEPVVGPDTMHQVLRGWLAHLGHDGLRRQRHRLPRRQHAEGHGRREPGQRGGELVRAGRSGGRRGSAAAAAGRTCPSGSAPRSAAPAARRPGRRRRDRGGRSPATAPSPRSAAARRRAARARPSRRRGRCRRRSRCGARRRPR